MESNNLMNTSQTDIHSKKFYYVVKKGIIPGIYNNWNDCKKQINGFSGALYKKFSSYEEAQLFLNNGQINELPLFDQNRVIYVDGACNNFTKPYALGSAVDHYGNDLIKNFQPLFTDMTLREYDLPVGKRFVIMVNFNDVVSQQNNGAELLATVAGMRIALYLIKNNYPLQYIFSDSNLIVQFWSKRIKDESAAKMDPNKLKYIHELISLRSELELLGCILWKISGDSNPADLGYHISK